MFVFIPFNGDYELDGEYDIRNEFIDLYPDAQAIINVTITNKTNVGPWLYFNTIKNTYKVSGLAVKNR